jgi:HEAT repeat protein
MRIDVDTPINPSLLVEVYCNKTSQGLPNSKDNLLKMANRMRQVGLLTDKELQEVSNDAERIVKGFKV